MNTKAFMFMLNDFDLMPQAVKKEVFKHAVIRNYIEQYPEVCKNYIDEVSALENGQLRVSPDKPLVPTDKRLSNGNGTVASAYLAIAVYPDGYEWSVSHFLNLLSVIEFDVALYLFSLFYQKHNHELSFFMDINTYLSTIDDLYKYPFLNHCYNLSRLFTIDSVNTLKHTDIMNNL